MPDDPFDLSDDDEEETPERAQESSVIQQFRKREKDLKKALKDAKAEAEALRPFKEEAQTSKLREAFTQAGLAPRHADLFRKVNPDTEPTAEAIKSFAEEYSLAPPAPVEEETQPKVPSFEPPPSGQAPTGTYTQKEFEEVMRVDPAKGRALAAAGRVRWNNEQPQRLIL